MSQTFLVLIDGYNGDNFEDDGMKIEAFDHADAAEDAVEEYESDSCEYGCMRGDEVKVSVKGPDGTIKKFVVTGEAQPVYYANEVE